MSEKTGRAGPGRKLIRYAVVLGAVCLVSGTALGTLFYATRGLIAENELKAFLASLEQAVGQVEDLHVAVEWPEDKPVPEGCTVTGVAGGARRYVTMDQEAFRKHFRLVDPEKALFIARRGNGVRYVATGSAKGYQSRIVVLAAVDASRPGRQVEEDPVIARVAVVSSGETPGLGENIKQVKAEVSLWAALAGKGVAASRRPWFQEQFSKKRLSELPSREKWDTKKLDRITGATITSLATANAVRAAVKRIIRMTAELYR